MKESLSYPYNSKNYVVERVITDAEIHQLDADHKAYPCFKKPTPTNRLLVVMGLLERIKAVSAIKSDKIIEKIKQPFPDSDVITWEL